MNLAWLADKVWSPWKDTRNMEVCSCTLKYVQKNSCQKMAWPCQKMAWPCCITRNFDTIHELTITLGGWWTKAKHHIFLGDIGHAILVIQLNFVWHWYHSLDKWTSIFACVCPTLQIVMGKIIIIWLMNYRFTSPKVLKAIRTMLKINSFFSSAF